MWRIIPATEGKTMALDAAVIVLVLAVLVFEGLYQAGAFLRKNDKRR